MADAKDTVRVAPLGGSGEIGKNLYVIEHDGKIVLIDCGVTFPNADQLGVDLVLPDFSYLEERRDDVLAVILTHGHEDHIGGLPYLIKAIGSVPIYGAKFTIGLVRSKLDEHKLARETKFHEVGPDKPVKIGPFEAEFVPLTHSIPDCLAVALHTPAGTVVHTGDFKFDHQPVAGPPADIPGLARLGDRGVLLLLADSTNSERGGTIRPERTVGEEMRRVFATAPGRVIVTTFSSHIHRVQGVLDAAYEDARSVALLGRSLNRNAGIAQDLGYLNAHDGVLVKKPRDLERLRADEQVVVCTGSQGETMAALSRAARGEHPQLQIEPGDTVVFSSRTVPGNELGVNDTINRLISAGARVMTEESDPDIHVSGHGSAADLLLMLQLIRPKFFAPIHGEPRHQKAHADLAMSLGVTPEQIAIMENGDLLEAGGERFGIIDRVPSGITYVDRMGGGDVAEDLLRDRRHLAEDGVVMVVATIDGGDGSVVGDVDVVARAFPADDELIEEVAVDIDNALQDAAGGRPDIAALQHKIHDVAAALIRKRSGQKPMVIPLVVDV